MQQRKSWGVTEQTPTSTPTSAHNNKSLLPAQQPSHEQPKERNCHHRWRNAWTRLTVVPTVWPLRIVFGVLLATVSLYYSISIHHTSHRATANNLSRLTETAARMNERPKPRVMGYYFGGVSAERLSGSNVTARYTDRTITVSKDELEGQERLQNSEDYQSHFVLTPVDEEGGDCKAQYEWQKQSFPTCNILHEQDLTHLQPEHSGPVPVRLLANGFWREVWMVLGASSMGIQQPKYALKTLRLGRFENVFAPHTYERQRRDAVAMERLSRSPSILDIHAFCGTSAINEFAPTGTLEDYLWWRKKRDMTLHEILVASYQVARAIADVHNLGEDTRPAAIVHKDIMMNQFVLVDGQFKLNDFNLCRFLAWNGKTNETCGFHTDSNQGQLRSPEEYMYELETEKVDVYSMGNIFYSLLTNKWPFSNETLEDTSLLVMQGKRPPIPDELKTSADPVHRSLLHVIERCWQQIPKERATSKEIAAYLRNHAEKAGPLPESSVFYIKD